MNDVYLDIPDDYMNIELHGNIWTSIGSVFKGLFQGAIKNAIISALKD